MFNAFLVLSILVSGSVFAQDMSKSEKFETAYFEVPDGSSRYVGKCSTHEDYDKFYVTTTKVLQKYIAPGDLSDKAVKAILAKFDKALISQVLKTFGLDDIGEEGATTVSIVQDYIDDITVESIGHVIFPNLDLIRFSVGVGGGNGGYVVFNKVKSGSGFIYEKMSHTFDSDLNFCDKKVWLGK
jgi:hypothetical protein